MKISVRELRQNLATYLKKASDGELIEIESRGTIVAMLCSCTHQIEGRVHREDKVCTQVSPNPTKKEIADKIVEEVMSKSKEGQIDIEPKMIVEGFHEVENHGLRKDVSKDSTDNTDGKPLMSIAHPQRVKNNMTEEEIGVESERLMNKLWENQANIPDEIVGTCDICNNPSKELWEHEEEGIERNVCRNCFRARVNMDDKQFEMYLSMKKKVQYEVIGKIPKTGAIMVRQSAKFTDFNPIPKPVKKKKGE